MPYQKILPKSGVVTDATQTLAKGAWSRSEHIRFRDGVVEKQFGWIVFTTQMLMGVCRALHAWMDESLLKYLAAGTNSDLYIYNNGTLVDITPIRVTHNVSVSFSTVSSSRTVKITDTAHGAVAGDTVQVYVPVSVGGIVLYGYYTVSSVVDANNYNITAASPATSTVNNTGAVPEFTTLNTSATVTVTLNNHGYAVNDAFNVDVSTTVATVVLSGEYLVASVVDANNFTIVAGSAANASTSAFENSGNVRLVYLLPVGPVSTMTLTGWGAGAWGSGTWGVGTPSADAVTPLRIWSLDNFKDTLVAAPSDGAIYIWNPPIATGNVAALLTGNPPTTVHGLFVAAPQLQIIAYGAEALGTQNLLLVRWCDAGDPTVWNATSTNQAGSFELSRGSKIVGGMQSSQAILLWTDIDIWQMQYAGLPYVYLFSMLSTGCGLIAKSAAAQVGRTVYWMSTQGFFQYAGSVQPIPCPVFDTIFQDLDLANADKVFTAPDSPQGEISWHYPSLSGGTGECDSYVKLNTLTGDWDYGSNNHTAWVDQNIFGGPLGVDTSGQLHYHGPYYNAGNDPLYSMAETGAIDIGDGDQIMFLDQIIPDLVLKGTNPQVQLTISTWEYPFDTPVSWGPFMVTQSTKYITMRARARQMSLRIESLQKDTWWRLGAVRARVAPDGKLP